MDFDILSTLIGVVLGGLGVSAYWVLKYNDIKFELGLERSMSEGLAQTLAEIPTTNARKR